MFVIFSIYEKRIPPELCVTAQKPDIVIIDNHKQAIHLYELTCSAERNIDTRNIEKSNKYAHRYPTSQLQSELLRGVN